MDNDLIERKGLELERFKSEKNGSQVLLKKFGVNFTDDELKVMSKSIGTDIESFRSEKFACQVAMKITGLDFMDEEIEVLEKALIVYWTEKEQQEAKDEHDAEWAIGYLKEHGHELD